MPLDHSLDDETYLGPKGTHDYASVLCSLLYVTICRLELACEVTQLQSFMKNPQVKHAKACNAMLKRALKDLKHFGLLTTAVFGSKRLPQTVHEEASSSKQ